jgi:hypothetical protein
MLDMTIICSPDHVWFGGAKHGGPGDRHLVAMSIVEQRHRAVLASPREFGVEAALKQSVAAEQVCVASERSGIAFRRRTRLVPTPDV